MDEEARREITSLAGEVLANQTVLGSVLASLAKVSPDIQRAIIDGFNTSADFAEHFAIVMGKSAAPEHTVKALRIVEELRAVALGNKNKPKHGI